MTKRNETQIERTIFSIRVKGNLTEEWSDWFEGLAVIQEKDGMTLIQGQVEDQAELFGCFKKVRNLGLPLISVNQVVSKNNNNFQGEKNEK